MKTSIAVAAVLAAVVAATPALSTPGSGAVGPVLARGTLDDKAKLKIKSHASDVVVQRITIAPGGQTGWHTHPGPAVVVIAAGTLTFYDGDDPGCAPHSYSTGMTFVDQGHGHVHIARNEGAVPVELYVTYLDVPVGGAFRIDAADPSNCSF